MRFVFFLAHAFFLPHLCTAAPLTERGYYEPGCRVGSDIYTYTEELLVLHAYVPAKPNAYKLPQNFVWIYWPLNNAATNTRRSPVLGRLGRYNRTSNFPLLLLEQSKLWLDDFEAGFFSTPNVDDTGLRSFGFDERKERKGREELSVFGSTACDVNGFNFLKLNVDNGTFVVNKFAEGEEVFIAPSNYTGDAISINLSIKTYGHRPGFWASNRTYIGPRYP
jgi:hypothetical protein